MLTCNVNGLAEKTKRTQLYRYLRVNEIDIACIQEAHCTKNRVKLWKNEWKGQIFFSEGESNARGVAIFVSYKTELKNVTIERDTLGRVMKLICNIEGLSYRLVNISAPNEDNPDFFAEIFNEVQLATEDHVMVLGDFNKYLNPEIDKKGGSHRETKASKVINEFLEQTDWVDVWHSLHEEQFQFTWKRKNPLIMHRLDYILAPLGTMNMVNSCEILYSVFTDHCPVLIEIVRSNENRGPGYWKCNNSHIHDPMFVNEMSETLDHVQFRYGDMRPDNKWEMLILDMRDTAIGFSRRKATTRKRNIVTWQNKITALNKKLAMINLSADNAIKIIQETNDKIDALQLKLK